MWPIAGTGRDLALLLNSAADGASNACVGSPAEIHSKYLRWGTEQIRMLQSRISASDLSRFVTSPRYWASVGIPGAGSALTMAIVEELGYRSTLLREAAQATQQAAASWAPTGGQAASLVLVDSNFFIEHADSFNTVDWHALIASPSGSKHVPRENELRLVIPMVVVDELDALTHKASLRAKAVGATKWLFGHLSSSTERVSVVVPPGEDRGAVTIQLVFDPYGHQRQAISDDEWIDRTVALRNFLGTPESNTFVLTYDTGAAFRARHAGLMPCLLPRTVD